MSAGNGGLSCALAGEAALVAGALVVLAVDLTLTRGRPLATRWRTTTVVGLASILAAIFLVLRVGAAGPMAGGGFMLDALGTGTRVGVLTLAGLTLLVAAGTARLRHPAEFVAIVLLATTGFTLMAVTQQLLLGFLAIELASLSLYVLAGFDKTRPESAEAGLKYFLLGGMSAAFLLFGFSLLYGLTGSIELPQMAATLAQQGLTPLLLVALVMILVAFGFKAAAAPFHLWAPDVYEGAPIPAAALVASASKLAGLTFFARLLWPGLGAVAGSLATRHGAPGWLPVLAVMSAASLLVGNFGALVQTNLRRLLAYSAIAHAGALLLGVMAAGTAGPAPLFYYAATYGLATVGAFGVVAVLERAGVGPRLTDLAGLYRRSPLLAGCLMIFILSLAGIPPLAGFFGKFAVFAAALKIGGLAGPAGWLAFAAIFLSAVALYYYLIVLKHALVTAPVAGAEGRIAVPFTAACALVIAGLLLVVLGLCPTLLLGIFP
jgi:NADH-quinone oxidoreductase subunit N